MKYTNLGRAGLKVSSLCLGTMNFGAHTTEQESFDIMNAALESGIQFFDTANVYGGKRGEGITEKIIGRWLDATGHRDEIVLASKVYGEMGDRVNDRGLSAYHIRKACEDSLRRLKTDRIDIYQMHHVDRSARWEEIWQAMEQLVREGKVLYVGSSNFAAIDIVQAQYEARMRNFMGLVSEQSLYHLNARAIELEIIPACERFGLGIIPWSPLGSGLLAGVLEDGPSLRRKEGPIIEAINRHRSQVEAWEELCREMGEKPADVALAWLLANPVVTAPIIGPRTLAQMQGSLRSLEINMPEDIMARLDEIWPGPGGRAPEAYAW